MNNNFKGHVPSAPSRPAPAPSRPAGGERRSYNESQHIPNGRTTTTSSTAPAPGHRK